SLTSSSTASSPAPNAPAAPPKMATFPPEIDWPSQARKNMCRRILFCLLLPLPALAGCNRQNGVAPPPKVQEVQVARSLERSDIVDYEVFTGRTEASDRVDLRARVTGYLVLAPSPADEGK